MIALLTALWAFLNTPLGLLIVASLGVFVLNRVYAKKPLWKSMEGTIIAGVKWAEKTIPDDTDNKGLLRLDCAMKYVLKVYAEMGKRPPSVKQLRELKEGVQIIHAELEGKGSLSHAETKSAT